MSISVASAAPLPRQKLLSYPATLPACGLTLALALAFAAFRGERAIGHDSFFYLQTAKALSAQLPSYLGGTWPYGYPFLASVLIRCGFHSYDAAVVISAVALFVLLLVLSKMLSGLSPTLGLLVPAFAAIPAISVLVLSPMSELTFAALLLVTVYSMGLWEKPPFGMLA